MKPSAVLLIDLENFYISREDYCRSGPPPGYDRARFAHDLDKLLGFVRAMTADRATGLEMPFTVKRAYADFNAARYPAGAPPQYYLRQLPDELLQQGVEPVQVFRLSRGGGRGSKNAADMRMAMDATALLASAGHVEHFILVTGDADFIPVILELKRHGHTVSVIGVTGATSPKIQRFVDNFELFEDLIAAEEVEARTGEPTLTGDGIARVAAALRRLLARTHPLRFAAVKPLLSKELGHAFDPGVFGCDTTGEFLRDHQTELGVVIRQGQHDHEIDLPGATGSNGSASRTIPKPGARQPEKPPNGKHAAPADGHTRAHYQHLLAGRGAAPNGGAAVKVPAVPWPVLVWGCDAAAALLAPPAGEPTHTTRLLPKLLRAADDADVPDLVKHLRTFYPTLRAGLPVRGADGVYALPAGTTGEQIRRSVLGYVAYVLRSRLAEGGGAAGEIRPDQLAAVFDPGPAHEQATAEVAAALAEPPPAPAPEPAARPPAPRPAAGAEEVHTPAGYVKLLKVGGPKGSDTEAFKVLPVPWASVERVCADAFPLLCPGAGGGPLPRDQLNARLVEVGVELFVEHYAQHVRRVLGVLRVAGDVTETDGVIALNPDVSSALDLRNRALAFLLQLLQLRLEEREVYDPIRAPAFVAALEAGPLSDRLLEEVAPAIEWLYTPGAADAPDAHDIAPDAPSVPADAEPAGPEPVAPTPDSGVLTVDIEAADPEPGPDPAPAGPSAPVSAAAVLSNSDPGWDPDAFDGALPEPDPAADANGRAPADARVRTAEPPESPSGILGVVDVARITREAVAAADEASLPPTEALEAVPAAPPAPAAPEPVEPTDGAGAEAEPELYPFAPPVETPAPARPVAADDEILTAMPIADWVTDGDPLFPGVEPVPHPAGDGRPKRPPPAEVSAAVARITSPHAAARRPPPAAPPPPPETA